MSTKEELEKLLKVAERKVRAQEKEINKQSNRKLLYQVIIGFALIGISKFDFNSTITYGGSEKCQKSELDLLILAGVVTLTISFILAIIKAWKGKK